jgi:hypothetical protein
MKMNENALFLLYIINHYFVNYRHFSAGQADQADQADQYSHISSHL